MISSSLKGKANSRAKTSELAKIVLLTPETKEYNPFRLSPVGRRANTHLVDSAPCSYRAEAGSKIG